MKRNYFLILALCIGVLVVSCKPNNDPEKPNFGGSDELTAGSPVGTEGMLDGNMGYVIDLGGNIGKVAITTMNNGASSATKGAGTNGSADCYGSYCSYNHAMEWYNKGWYVPSKEEMEALASHMSPWVIDGENVGCKWDLGNKTIYLPCAGYVQDGQNVSRGWQGWYWTSTPDSDPYKAYGVQVAGGECTIVSGLNREREMSLRLFHKLPIGPNDPVGTVGQLDGKEGIVVDLGGNFGKKVIAMFNYGSSESKKDWNYYYYQMGERLAFGSKDDANQNGWYVPSKEELEALAGHLSTDWGSEDGQFYYGARWNVDGTHTLYIPALGCMSWDNTHLMENTGVYMSRTEESEAWGTSWFLRFSEGGKAYVSTLYNHDRYYVRQFHDMPK